MGLLDRIFKPTQQKSYSSPELLLQYYGSSPRFNEWNTEKAVKEGFMHSTWVYSCVNLRASAGSGVPWIVERDVGGEWQLDETSDLAKLIAKPNPDMDFRTVIEYTIQHLDLSGNAYWSKVRPNPNAEPGQLWPLLPQAMKVVPGMTRLVSKYEYNLGIVKERHPARGHCSF